MLTRYIAIILLCISNLLLVGHNIVPHQHTTISKHSESSVHHHHHAHDHHHQQKEHHETDSDLEGLFAYMVHSTHYLLQEPEGQFLADTPIKKDNFIDLKSIIISEVQLENFNDKLILPFYRDPDHYPPPIFYKGLRAPPVLFS